VETEATEKKRKILQGRERSYRRGRDFSYRIGKTEQKRLILQLREE